MPFHHNGPCNFIDDPEDCLQYSIWFLSEHEGNNTQTSPTQVRNTKLDGVSNYHMFTDITMLNYIRPVKWYVQIINLKKIPWKGFGITIVKTPKTNIITPLCPS